MRRFWKPIIQPVFEILQPASVVEIGSFSGHNTQNILEFCQQSDAKLHVIDPAPKYDVSVLQEQYGHHFILHKDLSLNALPLIEKFDVVLIDGDHNWYTVINELKLIERRSREVSQPYPLVMLHDIGWPYGRRDLYYDPETIPDAYRKPYEQKGMHPESVGLLEEGGINPHQHNALLENEPQSGVLTAVQDFMRETEQQVELLKIPGFHGLGLLVPWRLKEQNETLARFLDTLNLPEPVVQLLEQVERARIQNLLHISELKKRNSELKARASKQERKARSIARYSSWGFRLIDAVAEKALQMPGLRSLRRRNTA